MWELVTPVLERQKQVDAGGLAEKSGAGVERLQHHALIEASAPHTDPCVLSTQYSPKTPRTSAKVLFITVFLYFSLLGRY